MGTDATPETVRFPESLRVAREPNPFMSITSKPHAQIAGDMADEIKAVIYKHAGAIPLALAIGVLRIIEHELLEDA